MYLDVECAHRKNPNKAPPEPYICNKKSTEQRLPKVQTTRVWTFYFEKFPSSGINMRGELLELANYKL